MRQSKKCKECGKLFYKEKTCPQKRWEHTRKFCSKACLSDWRRGNPDYKKKLNLKGLSLGHQKGNKHGFQKGVVTISGENHHSWKGGVTSLNKNIRKMAEYKIWRLDVFERDNFTCEDCGKRGGDIQADHIIPFSFLVSFHNVKTYKEARECKDLWDINNGRTLCVQCHYKTPTWGIKATNFQHN